MIEAIGCYVVVKMPPKETKTAGGIIIPDDVADKGHRASSTGEIVSVGANCRHVKPQMVGRTAHFGRYVGTLVEQGEDEFRLIDEDEIRGIENG